MQTVFIGRPTRIPEAHIEQLRIMGVNIYEGPRPSAQELAKIIANAEVLIAFYNDDLEKVIYDASKLKHFINTSVGYERLDLERFRQKGVIVSNCPTYNSQAVAELALGLLISVIRKINLASQDLKSGEWNDEIFAGSEIAGKNVGLVGYGNIGKIIKRSVEAIGAEAKFVNSKSTPAEVDELCSWADSLIICATLNAQTKHMIDRKRLELLKSGAVVINISRGAIIDENALYKILKTGKISAGLDVFEFEPERGRVNQEILRLAELPNVVATPHIAYNTEESGDKLGKEIIANVKAAISGNPINVVGSKK